MIIILLLRKHQKNLLKENINEDSILVTGNTVIDALLSSVDKINENPSQLVQELSRKLGNNEVVLVTDTEEKITVKDLKEFAKL